MCIFLFTLLHKSKNKMKQPSQFDLIESQQLPLPDAPLGSDFFEQEKIAYPFDEHQDEDHNHENTFKTPKSKKTKKLILKNNPEDNSGSKISKFKQKKYKNMSQEKQKNPNQLFGHWSVQQNKRYHWFLEIHHMHFMNRSLRRTDRIFTSMAKFVGTREAQQCRSHHQKMQKKHKIFPKILLNLRSSYYGSCNVQYLIEDIEQNQVDIIDPLLTEQFLVENLTLREVENQGEFSRDEGRSEEEQKEEQIKPKKTEEKIKNVIELPPIADADMIEEIIGPEVQSSKNYFKFLNQNSDRNNILDDGYESNLPFGHMF